MNVVTNFCKRWCSTEELPKNYWKCLPKEYRTDDFSWAKAQFFIRYDENPVSTLWYIVFWLNEYLRTRYTFYLRLSVALRFSFFIMKFGRAYVMRERMGI